MAEPNQRKSRWPLIHSSGGALVAAATYEALTRGAHPCGLSLLAGRRSELYGPLLGALTTVLGFAIAALAVVLGYAQSPRFQMLRDGQWFAAMFGAFTSAVKVLALASAVALLALLFDRDQRPVVGLSAAAAGATIAASASLMRLLVVLERVIDVVIKDPTREPGK